MNNPNGIDNLVTPPRKRGPGRPPSPFSTIQNAQARRIAKAKAVLAAEISVGIGAKAMQEEFTQFPRLQLDDDAPERTPSEAKDAAFKLLNKMLWAIEKNVKLRGADETDEARVLKLLAGLNAALPKAAEAKPLSEMTNEEIKAVVGVK